MFHVQVRRYLPDAETPAEVLEVQEIQMSGVASATAALTLKVSLAVSDGIRDWIEANPGKAFIVGVEYSKDGGPWQAPRNNLFVAYKGSADDADPSETVSVTCMDWISWQLARTYVHWAPSAKNGERLWTPANGSPVSAGFIMHGMLTESKGRGWGPKVHYTFNSGVDSAGSAWAAGEKIAQRFRLLTPLSQALGSLTEQGLCDWWTEGTELRLFRPGVGVDRTEVVLGGAGFARAPGAWDFSNVFTNLTVVPEKARNWLYLTNTGADTSFGRLEATMTQSGVADHPTATRLAQPILAAGRSASREQSYEWTVAGDMPVPWVDFNTHDLVTIDTAFGTREERVVELIVRVRDDVVTCVAVTGDKLLSVVAKRDRRAQAAVIGNVIGGSGNGLPGASVPAVALPRTPDALRVESNNATWRSDGTAQATVRIAWDPVTQTEDDSDVDIAGYEVATRTDLSEPVTFGTTGVTFTATDWEPGVRRFVKVRALPQTGSPSEWSAELIVTSEIPASIVPTVPSNLRVTATNVSFQQDGRVRATASIAWDPVSLSLDGVLVEIEEYEVNVAGSTARVTEPAHTVDQPGGDPATVTVRARTTLGVWGDPTPPLELARLTPEQNMQAPSAPILASGLSVVVAAWDGKLGTVAPVPGFGFVVIETATSETGPWAQVGSPLSAKGSTSVAAEMGSTVWVRLRSIDTLGRNGGTSAAQSVVVVGIEGDDIEADTITGNKVRAGTLEVNNVSPTFGDDLNLSANESVTIIVGTQNEQADQLANVAESVGEAQSTADAATSAAGTAQATANGAASAAAGAATAAAAVGQRLDRHQTYYRFGVDGLAIGDPNVPSELRLKPDRIEMTQNNVVVSYWEGGVFVADEARLDSAQIGNHLFTAYGSGRTIIRPL